MLSHLFLRLTRRLAASKPGFLSFTFVLARIRSRLIAYARACSRAIADYRNPLELVLKTNSTYVLGVRGLCVLGFTYLRVSRTIILEPTARGFKDNIVL